MIKHHYRQNPPSGQPMKTASKGQIPNACCDLTTTAI
jgi:hypothetical protein